MPSFDVSMRMNALARACAQLMLALRESSRSILHGIYTPYYILIYTYVYTYIYIRIYLYIYMYFTVYTYLAEPPPAMGDPKSPTMDGY